VIVSIAFIIWIIDFGFAINEDIEIVNVMV
jgi:hypothetical protein